MIHMAGRYPTASPGPKRGTLVGARCSLVGHSLLSPRNRARPRTARY
ncbi:hypothetical protein BX281_1082 [Streptomyces sp. Ag82_O1-15]|jgi:hypothetical protein|nr:hypothetical protein BX281_1082 [Streptomyces sp. Ag82_O1-15]